MEWAEATARRSLKKAPSDAVHAKMLQIEPPPWATTQVVVLLNSGAIDQLLPGLLDHRPSMIACWRSAVIASSSRLGMLQRPMAALSLGLLIAALGRLMRQLGMLERNIAAAQPRLFRAKLLRRQQLRATGSIGLRRC